MFNDKALFNNSIYFPNSFRAIICGKSNCGKTYLLFNFLFNHLDFHNLIICSTSNQKCYEVLEKCFEAQLPINVIKNIFDNHEIIEDVDEVINDIVNDEDFEQGEINFQLIKDVAELPSPDDFDRQEKTLIFLDDSAYEKEQSNIEKLFFKGRHANINVIYITQSYYRLPKQSIRDNANLLFLFKVKGTDKIHIFNDWVSGDMTSDEFNKFYSSVCNPKFGFMTISLDDDLDCGRFRKSLDMFYTPNPNT